jgi:hypothetical protein
VCFCRQTLFRRNKIDGVALLLLTNDDLTALGVQAFGHRKKIVAAIDVLNQKLRAPDGPPGAPQGGPPRPQPVPTIGLVARNINGVVKIFDTKTGEEVGGKKGKKEK